MPAMYIFAPGVLLALSPVPFHACTATQARVWHNLLAFDRECSCRMANANCKYLRILADVLCVLQPGRRHGRHVIPMHEHGGADDVSVPPCQVRGVNNVSYVNLP